MITFTNCISSQGTDLKRTWQHDFTSLHLKLSFKPKSNKIKPNQINQNQTCLIKTKIASSKVTHIVRNIYRAFS